MVWKAVWETEKKDEKEKAGREQNCWGFYRTVAEKANSVLSLDVLSSDSQIFLGWQASDRL